MASLVSTNLTPDMITREMQRVLHTKAQFCGTINREYDDSFAQEGAKIGATLRIRLPRKYTVSTGAALSTQAPQEYSVTLPCSTQAHVDTTFTTAELALDIDDFSDRIITPAMSQLAAYIDNDALTMGASIAPSTGTPGTSPTNLLPYLQAKAKLNQQASPVDEKRTALVSSETSASLVNGLSGIFQSANQISNQYLQGKMGLAAGFTFYESDLLNSHTTGNFGTTGAAINDAATTDGQTTVNMDTFSNATPTLTVGDVFTVAGVFDVHPETKVPYSHLKQFVVTAAATGATNAITGVTFSPAWISTGVYQNVSALPADDAVVAFTGDAATSYKYDLCYHRDAFTMATADLEMPNDVHFKSRIVFENISMRLLRQYTISDDAIPARVDVLYGYVPIHDDRREPQAVRVWG